MSIKKYLAFFFFFLTISVFPAAAADLVKDVKEKIGIIKSNASSSQYTSSLALAARQEFIKLSDAQVQTILGDVSLAGFFGTPYGFSLVHVWMLNKFNESGDFFCIKRYFGFDKYIRSLINKMPAALQESLNKLWFEVEATIETNFWSYYQLMQYFPDAIAQARSSGAAVGTIPGLPIIIRSCFIFALSSEDFRSHIESIISDTNFGVDAQIKFESIMIALLNYYNLASLLPEGSEIVDALRFTEFVVEHVKRLYTAVTDESSVDAIKAAQLGERLLVYFTRLGLSVGQQLEAINRALEFVRSYHASIPAADTQITIPLRLIPIYASVIPVAGTPSTPPRGLSVVTVEPVTPPRSSVATGITVFPAFVAGSPSKLGGGKVPMLAPEGITELARSGVYPTPFMETWMNAASSGTSLPVDLSAYEIDDILKFFASYLDKVKRRDGSVDKGPSTGNLGSRTFLIEVLAMRYKLLSGDPTALATARTFANKVKKDFFNSMQKRGLVAEPRR